MDEHARRVIARRRQHVLNGVAAAGGLALLAVALDRVGVSEVVDGVGRVGWAGVLAMLGLAGVRFALRATSWRLCMGPRVRMPFGRAFAAFLAGDAIGNVTPLGMLASEPAKAFLVRHRLAAYDAVASLAVDNLFYAASAVVLMGVGVLVALAVVPLPRVWQAAAVAGLVVVAAVTLVALRLARGTWDDARGPRPAWRQRLSAMRESVVGFVGDHPGRLQWIAGVDALFHVLAVVEVYVVLWGLLGAARPTLGQAVVFEALNRFVTVVFKFVPFRVGVDEAFSGALAPLVTVDPATGVTLAVLRKGRNLFWTAVGLTLIGAAPVRGARAPDLPESADAPPRAPR